MVQIGSRAIGNVLFVQAVLSYQATKPRVGPDDLILPMDHETIKAFEERVSSKKPHVPLFLPLYIGGPPNIVVAGPRECFAIWLAAARRMGACGYLACGAGLPVYMWGEGVWSTQAASTQSWWWKG